MKSVASKKEERIKDALKALKRLEHNFKDSKFKDDIEKLRTNLKNELSLLASTTKK